MTTTPDTLAPLAKALAAAQAEMTSAAKDGHNPAFHSSYATLASCLDACRGPLTRHGLAVVQMPRQIPDGLVEVETMLLHESGASVSSALAARPVKSDPQGIGSAITYLRRYGLLAMVGLAPDDDDGEAASGRTEPPPKPAPPKPSAPKPAPAPKAKPAPEKATHDPTWAADRPKFCAELTRIGTDYDRVSAWTEGKGWGRPSGWPQTKRDNLLDYLLSHPDEIPAREPGED